VPSQENLAENRPIVLVIHGVATKPNHKLTHAQDLKKLIDRELKRKSMSVDYSVDAYQYEDHNRADPAAKLAERLFEALKTKQPIAGHILQTTADLISDVVITASGGVTAKKILREIKDKIMSYHPGQRIIMLAHSLGSVYALQAINELINEGYFDSNNRYSWPVFSLVTIGSPLGLTIKLPGGLEIFPHFPLQKVASNFSSGTFRWHNLYHSSDPIVTGQIFGSYDRATHKSSPLERRYLNSAGTSNWLIRHYHIGTGERWLLAHIAYWNDPSLGHLLLNEIA
jgi:hypothetical protein